MINKTKLQQTKDLQEFLILENDMLMSSQEYQEHLKCLRLCARDARLADDVEGHDFYIDLIKALKNDCRAICSYMDI